MPFLDNAKLKQARVQQKLIGEQYTATPDAQETLSLAFRETRANELFTSEVNMKKRFLGPQKRKLETLRDDGTIPQAIWNTFDKQTRRGRRVDWEGLADYANEELDADFDFTQESMAEVMRDESQQRKNQLGKVAGWGNVPSFVGTLGAIATDPIQMTAMLIPGSQMRFAATGVGTLTKMAFREGAINVGVEGVVQLQVADFKHRIGMEYNLSEGAANLAAAFTFGGLFGATRAGFRMQMGDTNLTHAIEMQDGIIREMEGRGPLMPTENSMLYDMKLSQDIFHQMIEETPSAKNMSVRDAYTEVAQRLRSITDPGVNAATRASTVTDTDLEAASHAPDELTADFVPSDIDLDAPIASDLLEGRPAAVVDEAGVEQPVTMRTLYDEVDAKYESVNQRVQNYVECRNG